MVATFAALVGEPGGPADALSLQVLISVAMIDQRPPTTLAILSAFFLPNVKSTDGWSKFELLATSRRTNNHANNHA